MAAKQIQTERDHQKLAFEHYYALGPKRSYKRVADKFKVAPSTVKSWGRSFDWRGRIAERDAQVAREVATRTLNDEVSLRKRSLQIVQMSIVQLAKSIAQGKVRMTLGDLDKLIRLEAFLTDQPDSRQEIIFGDLKNKSRQELREMMRAEMETLKELESHESELEDWERERGLLEVGSGESDEEEK